MENMRAFSSGWKPYMLLFLLYLATKAVNIVNPFKHNGN
jgi:hypothetical protein